MIEVSDATFASEVLDHTDGPVLVDFWAPWCGPCKMLGPIFESVAQEYQGKAKFVKVNIDETSIASKYGIRSIPTIIAFKNGQPVSTNVGNIPKSKVQLIVESTL